MDIRIPNLGEGAESGSVVSLFVKVGDRVSKDQTLVELENEKAVAPIPSTHAGVVQKIYVNVGDKVSVGQAIVSLSDEGGQNAEAPAAPQARPAVFELKDESSKLKEIKDVQYGKAAASFPGIPAAASPSIRKMAQDLGIDLSKVRGSEPGGRIVLADLRAYINQLQSAQAPAAGHAPAVPPKAPSEKIDFSKWGPVKKAALSSLRQKIGQKMSESWTTIPHVTQFEEADITELMALRKKALPAYEKKGARLTLTHFVMKAVVAALKKYPQFNSSLDEESHELVTKEYFHIGIAVDTESGLIVPVVRDADKKSMLDLAKELDALAEKTRRRKVSIDELKGGTFTISNLGGIGGTFFTPIVNKPEVAILGIGRGVLKPVIVKGKTKNTTQARLMMPLGLSYDHRVIDGADGARFITEIKNILENFDPKLVKL